MLLDIATGAIGITAGRLIEVWTQWLELLARIINLNPFPMLYYSNVFGQLTHCAQVWSSQEPLYYSVLQEIKTVLILLFCICLLTDSQVGAWTTFLCLSQSQKGFMIHTSSRTSLLATTAHSASYWSCRRYCTGAPQAILSMEILLLGLVCKCCSFRFAQMMLQQRNSRH
jgi:hypothetical protein